MGHLEKFTEAEQAMIVSLPYRAGIFVSDIDKTGQGAASYTEIFELETIIGEETYMAALSHMKPRLNEEEVGLLENDFVTEVMANLRERQDEWRTWKTDKQSLLKDCSNTIRMLEEKLGEREVAAYRACIIAIAIDVAKAFCEQDVDAPFLARCANKTWMFFDSMVRFITRDKFTASLKELNVSYKEDIALTLLSEALTIGGGHEARDSLLDEAIERRGDMDRRQREERRKAAVAAEFEGEERRKKPDRRVQQDRRL